MDNLLRIMLCVIVICVGITRMIDPTKADRLNFSGLTKSEENEPSEFYYRCVRIFSAVMVVVMVVLIVLILLGKI